jgi:uncharacterized protein YggE
MRSKTQWMSTLLTLAFLMLITGAVAYAAPVTQAVPAGENAQQITVLGYGEAATPADIVEVRLAVATQQNYGPTGPEFTPVDEQSVQLMVEALVENGIDASDIVTNTFGWSSYSGTSAGEVTFTYTEPSNLTTFLTDLQETLRDHRGPALPLPATSFRVEDCIALESGAWQAALDNARQRVEQVAEQMTVELGELVTVAEIPPVSSAYGTSVGGCAGLEQSFSTFMPVPTVSANSASEVKVSIFLQATYTFE